jgi:hypothetical protein
MFCPLVAFWSRQLDPFGRIWCSLVLVITAELWWRGLLQVTKLSLEISNNKAASSSVFACGRSAEQLWRIFFDKLPRRKMMEESSVAGSSKKRCQLLIVDPQLPFLLSAGRGGEGRSCGAW